MAEFVDVLHRPGLAKYINSELRVDLLGQFRARAAVVVPTVIITDCRDAKDNKYLELALAAAATTIVQQRRRSASAGSLARRAYPETG